MTALMDELLVRGADDWVTAAEVAWIAKSLGDASTVDGIQSTALHLIRDVLEAGWMEAGDVTEQGFVPWNLPPDQSFDRIEKAWRALGHSPDLGEVCWLAITPTGSQRVESLADEGGVARQRDAR